MLRPSTSGGALRVLQNEFLHRCLLFNNYVNVNAFYFDFTLILVEIDV